jgi:hypothetical protein
MELHDFTPRFVDAAGMKEMLDIYHVTTGTKHERMIKASKRYALKHNLSSSTGAYKDLSSFVMADAMHFAAEANDRVNAARRKS